MLYVLGKEMLDNIWYRAYTWFIQCDISLHRFYAKVKVNVSYT